MSGESRNAQTDGAAAEDGYYKILSPMRHPNGFCILPVHYSMDPRKTEAWAREERSHYRDPADWDQQMEIAFSAVSGVRVFYKYTPGVNLKQCRYTPGLPLRLACDFNVHPMAWVVSQYQPPCLYSFDMIWLTPGSVEEACEVFLDLYGEHEGEVIVYGDPAGHARQQKDGKSNYDTMRLMFLGRKFNAKFRVPVAHYAVKDSVASVNAFLADEKGIPRWFIHPERCKPLVQDLAEVVWDDNRKSIKKSNDAKHPYYERTHAAEAMRNLIHREWPYRTKVREAIDGSKAAPKKREYKNVYGRV